MSQSFKRPLAGGASTPRLAAAVSETGGPGFLAAGYKSADAVHSDIRELRSLTSEPFGVNIFAPPGPAADAAELHSYAAQLQAEADRYGVELGEARHDDDYFAAKLALVVAERVEIVSFTFGCPEPEVVARLRGAGCDVWVTVTNPDEAIEAQPLAPPSSWSRASKREDIARYFKDGPYAQDLGLLVTRRLVAHRVDLPLVAAGGITDGASVAAALCAGAAAAQVGTALMLSPEAGTSSRTALRSRPQR